MKFMIAGNVEEIEKYLESFVSMCCEEYKNQVAKSEKKMKNYTGWIPVPVNVSLPPELVMRWYREGDYVVLENQIALPKVLRGAFERAMKRKMEKNLRGFFKENGIEVEVKYMGN